MQILEPGVLLILKRFEQAGICLKEANTWLFFAGSDLESLPLWFDDWYLDEDAKTRFVMGSAGDFFLERVAEVGKGDEVETAVVFDGHEGVAFDFARFEETGVCLQELFVAIAGVGDQFEGALGHCGDERVDGGDVQGAGGQTAHGAVGSVEAFFFDDAAKAGLVAAQEDDFSAAQLWRIGCGVEAPDGLEGIANGVDAGSPGSAQHGPQDGRKHMNVLVRVDVGEAKAVALQESDLRGGFGFDIGAADARCE